MNPELEVCRNCKVQCRLEDRSKSLVAKAKEQPLKDPQVRELISAMTLMARGIPCPQTEIARIRIDTLEQINPKLVARDSRFRHFAPKELDPGVAKDLGFTRNPNNPRNKIK